MNSDPKDSGKSRRIRRNDPATGDAWTGAAFGRVETPDGRIIRVETDGAGGLVEFCEGHVPDVQFGIEGVELKMDRAKIERMERLRLENPITPAARHDLVLEVVRNENGIRAQAVADFIGHWRSQVATSLLSLQKRGLVYYTRKNRGDPDRCLWYAVQS